MVTSPSSPFTVVVMIIQKGQNFSAEASVYKRIPAQTRSEAFDLALEHTFNMKGGSFLKAHIQQN